MAESENPVPRGSTVPSVDSGETGLPAASAAPTIAVVVPTYNEETKIAATLRSIPPRVCKIYAVNDASTDRTSAIMHQCAEADPRIAVIDLPSNSGVGAAIVAGYREVIRNGEDIAVVMAGDGQMDPGDLDSLVEPVLADQCDYAKGNRFLRGRNQIEDIPRHRLIGNLVLSVLTKIASGYWHVSDSQSGYTAINRRALMAVDWSRCYPRYGCPNDYLVRLNIANMRVTDVPIRAVYGPAWQSHMKPVAIAWPLLFLLFRLFRTRMFYKYVVANGHPIVIFYAVAAAGMLMSALLFLWVAFHTVVFGRIPQTATILWGMTGMVSLQLILHAFEMDYRDNEWLCVHRRDQ
jgi:glycosyltransferase involved in cell wall biosynthesis